MKSRAPNRSKNQSQRGFRIKSSRYMKLLDLPLYTCQQSEVFGNMLLRSVLLSFCLQVGWSQTQIDLQAQGRNVDFTGSASTRPMKSGTALPATCNVGELFFLTSTTAGANIYGCAATNAWSLQSGGGSGVQNASQLSDLMAAISAPTTLSIGATCTSSTPCNVRLGSVTFSFTSSTSATISGGTGTAYIYLDSSGNLTVGHNLTVTCSSGCVAVPGVTAFPSDSLPLFTWTATNGTWDTAGGADRRAFQSTANVYAAAGLLSITANGRTTLSVDPTVVGVLSPVPATSSSPCAQGAWSTDTSYYYVCVAANTWLRAALTTW